jgi:uncharacterized protein with ATP-grasp and redox domains
MISDHRCFFCLTRAFEKLVEKENIPNEAKSRFTHEMITLYQNNWEGLTAPEFSRELHGILKSYTNNPDPYKDIKKENNDQALNFLPELSKFISQSRDPFGTALRIAVAGNIMDFAVNDNFNLKATISKTLDADFAIDHSARLKEKLFKAESVLYLGDNAGEIVFDKLFIETIKHPNLVYVVRGSPVINDATMEDAEYVGMKEIVSVISNGYDAPSTIPEKCSFHFKDHFSNADLIISKGQGNLEGLATLNDKRIFFLLMVKCNVMAEFLHVKKDSLVVYNPSG